MSFLPKELFPENYEVRLREPRPGWGLMARPEAEFVSAELPDGGLERAPDELGVYERNRDCVSHYTYSQSVRGADVRTGTEDTCAYLRRW